MMQFVVDTVAHHTKLTSIKSCLRREPGFTKHNKANSRQSLSRGCTAAGGNCPMIKGAEDSVDCTERLMVLSVLSDTVDDG